MLVRIPKDKDSTVTLKPGFDFRDPIRDVKVSLHTGAPNETLTVTDGIIGRLKEEDCGCPDGAEEQCIDILCPRK